jgi:hypothetical protein
MLDRKDVEKGMAVRFTGKDGLAFAIEQASKILNKKDIYTISDIFKDKWGCYIYLEGVPNKSFNCLMFDDAGIYVPEEPKQEKKVVAPKKKK